LTLEGIEMRLRDKVAIITGGGQGLGRAFAEKFAEEGAKVVIADKSDDTPQNVVNDIVSRGQEAVAFKTDVTNEESTIELSRQVIEKYGHIDILVNNAAFFSGIKVKPIEEMTLDEWDIVMDVNLKGLFLSCKSVIPQMKAQKSGKIINISSATFFMGKPFYIHYVTSKAGVIGFTRALSREVGDWNINVNCITPGYMKTEIPRKTTTPEVEKMIINRQIIKRVGVPEDLLGLMVFLASNESDFMSGQTVNIDGGDNLH
jgi:3-oxoacyl-[acyl-carrier protein] reductase